MGKLHSVLLFLYLTAAAGYGGWRGRELWSGWGVWILFLLPAVWAVAVALGDWRDNRLGWTSLKIALIAGAFGVMGVALPALLIAWVIGEATARWSPEPAVRAMIGSGLGAAVGGVALLGLKPKQADQPQETNDSQGAGGLAGPGADSEHRPSS